MLSVCYFIWTIISPIVIFPALRSFKSRHMIIKLHSVSMSFPLSFVDCAFIKYDFLLLLYNILPAKICRARHKPWRQTVNKNYCSKAVVYAIDVECFWPTKLYTHCMFSTSVKSSIKKKHKIICMNEKAPGMVLARVVGWQQVIQQEAVQMEGKEYTTQTGSTFHQSSLCQTCREHNEKDKT